MRHLQPPIRGTSALHKESKQSQAVVQIVMREDLHCLMKLLTAVLMEELYFERKRN